MKKYISFLFFISLGTLFCMETILITSKNYVVHEKIDAKYEQKFQQLILLITEENALYYIKKIEGELVDYTKKRCEKMGNFSLNLKKKYSMPDDQWDICSTITHQLTKIYTEKLSGLYEPFVHDSAIPQWFMVILKNKLKEVGIDSRLINICSNNTLATEVRNLGVQWSYQEKANQLVVEFCNTGRIGIPVKALNINNLPAEEGRCLIIAQHLKNGAVDLGIVPVLKGFGINIEKVDEVKYKELCVIHGILDTILKNLDNISSIKSFYKITNPSMISIKIYKELSKVYFLWQSLEWIKKYYTTNYLGLPLFLSLNNPDKDMCLKHIEVKVLSVK